MTTPRSTVDPVYGTLDDLERLLAKGHARGLRLVLDARGSRDAPSGQASSSLRDSR